MSTFSSMNLMRRSLLLPALLASAFLPLTTATAAFDTFTDQGAFMDQFTGPDAYIEENFSSLDTADRSDTHFFEYSNSATQFTISTTPGLEENAIWKAPVVGDDHWIATEASDGTIQIDFASGVYAVGGYFFRTDINGNAIYESLYLSINDGEAFKLFDVVTEDRPFFGIWSTDVAIEKLVFSTAQTTSGQYVSMSNLTVTNVPEPSTYVFLGASALALLSLKRRRR